MVLDNDGSSPTAGLLILFFLILFYFLFLYFYYILFIALFFIILLGMDPKCLLTSTDLQTRRARCQHQLSFLLYYYPQYAAMRQNAGIIITQRPKISIFAPQGRLFALIHMKFGMDERHFGLLDCAKFHLAWPHEILRQSVHGGGNVDPKISIFPLFGKESPHRGKPFYRFLKILRAFICPTILH